MSSSSSSSADTPRETHLVERPPRRSRAGCWNCRSKTVKKRCDQQQPSCSRCIRLGIECDYSKRPTLAERRKAEKLRKVEQIEDTTTGYSSSSSESTTRQSSASRQLISLSIPRNITHSLDLTTESHEAIRFFRSSFAKTHHVKSTDYSLLSLMFRIAKVEPMVMHMVIATGLQELNVRRPRPNLQEQQISLRHYSSALRSMADTISSPNGPRDLDIIFTALWMMLLYEQQSADPRYSAYKSHLDGISSLLQHSSLPSGSIAGNLESKTKLSLSVYAVRVLVWIALLDAAAASSGIGGQVNAAILNLLLQRGVSSTVSFSNPIQAFAGFHQYSGPLYRIAWGDKYPQNESIDDFENRDAYSLLAACVALRFLTAQLANHYQDDATVDVISQAIDVESQINAVGTMYESLIEAASKLSLDTDNSYRLTSNLRAVVPMYHAVLMDFMRVTSFDQALSTQQYYSIQEIMNLAFQGYKHGGDEAMIKIAWPLFMVAVETNDMLQQNWILERFHGLCKYGQNFSRAYAFLQDVLPMQHALGKRVNLRAQMEIRPIFVLS